MRDEFVYAFQVLFAFALVVNVAMNLLDLTTTFIGFSEGIKEATPFSLLFVSAFGEYPGVIIEKAIIIGLAVLPYWRLMSDWGKRRLLVLCLGFALEALFALAFALVVWGNLKGLGLL